MPSHCVEGFSNVDHEEDTQAFAHVQECGHCLDSSEVVVQGPTPDERALVRLNKLVHAGASH
jgi:hypothetical protein